MASGEGLGCVHALLALAQGNCISHEFLGRAHALDMSISIDIMNFRWIKGLRSLREIAPGEGSGCEHALLALAQGNGI